MFQESFEIKVKKGKRIPKNVKDEDEGSEIEDDEEILDVEDEEEQEILDFLQKAFSEVADVTKYGNNEYMLDFYEPNTKLVEDDSVFDFDVSDNVPVLNDTELFIPFVNFMKDFEPALTGITLQTNLEGGGHLVI
jgi:predicted membrane GTPase involved in stress response